MREPGSNSFWEKLSNSALIRFLLMFACGWAAILILDYFESVIVIFTSAAIVAFLLSYPVQWLRRFLPHSIAVSIVFFVSLIIITGLTITVGLTILYQGQQLIASVTDFLYSLAPLVQRLEEFLRERNLRVNLDGIENQLRTQVLGFIFSSLATLQTLLANLVTIILIAVVALFMLLDGERIWNLLIKFVAKPQRSRLTFVIKRKFLGFFKGQLLLMLFLTISSFVVFVMLGVPFPLVLAVIVGIFDLIPGIGATLGVSIISLIVLSQGVWLAVKVLAACIVLQQIQDNLIAPRVMQDSLNLNPVVVFFALLVGVRVAGLLGIFIAIPLAGVVVTWFEIEEMQAEQSG